MCANVKTYTQNILKQYVKCVLTSFFYVHMSREKLEGMNFKQNRMKEELVSCRPLGWVFFQALRYEILQNVSLIYQITDNTNEIQMTYYLKIRENNGTENKLLAF